LLFSIGASAHQVGFSSRMNTSAEGLPHCGQNILVKKASVELEFLKIRKVHTRERCMPEPDSAFKEVLPEFTETIFYFDREIIGRGGFPIRQYSRNDGVILQLHDYTDFPQLAPKGATWVLYVSDDGEGNQGRTYYGFGKRPIEHTEL
jgi:hypothetical protein